MKSHKLITPMMIRKALVQRCTLKFPLSRVHRCPPHANRSDLRFGGICSLYDTGVYKSALILDPQGVIEVNNPLIQCGRLRSRRFWAMGGSSDCKLQRGPAGACTNVDVATFSGQTVEKRIFAMNPKVGVTKHMMKWCSNLGFTSPESWTPGISFSIYRQIANLFHLPFISLSPLLYLCFPRRVVSPDQSQLCGDSECAVSSMPPTQMGSGEKVVE